MKTYTTFLGYQGATPTSTFSLRGIRNRTATTNIGGLGKTARIIRLTEAKERVEGEFNSILGLERMKDKAQKQRNDYRAYRLNKKLSKIKIKCKS